MYGFGSGGGDGDGTGFWVFVGLIVLLVLFWVFVVWAVMTIIVGIRLSRLCRRVGVDSPGLSYVPILAETRVAKLAGANPWLNVLALIPLLNIVWLVLTYVWAYRIAKPGDRMVWWLVSVAGYLVVIAIGAIPDLPDGVAYVSLLGLVAIVVGRWMMFDPAIANRLRPDASVPPIEQPAEAGTPTSST